MQWIAALAGNRFRRQELLNYAWHESLASKTRPLKDLFMPSTRSPAPALPRGLVATFAIACGLTVGNIYYAQPLLATLAHAFGTSEASAALIVTITQVGYAVGLLILVPLGDLVENRRLVVTISAGTVLALLVASAAPSLAVFFVASLGIGVTSVVAQVLVPFAAHLAPPETRGRAAACGTPPRAGNFYSGAVSAGVLNSKIGS